MTISPFAPGTFSNSLATQRLVAMKSQLSDLQRQLGSGQKSESHGGLGTQRYLSLDVRARISVSAVFQQTSKEALQRTSLMAFSLQEFVKTRGTANSSLAPNSWLGLQGDQSIGQRQTASGLDFLIDLMNEEDAGRYLFSGRAADTKPVLDSQTILNGDGAGRAGVKQFIAERKLADLGAGDMGRLNLAAAGAAVTLAEDGNPNFGFRLQALTSTLSNATAAPPAGAPASLSVTFTGAPANDETITLTLRLPDGSDEQITLTAKTDAASGALPGNFLIGATPAATAANFQAKLQTAIETESRTSLQASSAMLASQDFFSGSLNAPPRRIAGPPFASATGFVPGTAANSVIWYRGDDDFPVNPGSAGPRATQPARIDKGLTIGTGAQANESGLRDTFAAFAVAASELYPASDSNSRGRYESMTLRIRRSFGSPPGGVKPETITGEVSLVAASVKAADDRHKQRISFFQGVVSEIEGVSNEQVASELLSLQTRLEASYQATAIIGRLTLTSYLR